jgi:hypothetical protein
MIVVTMAEDYARQAVEVFLEDREIVSQHLTALTSVKKDL